MEKIIDPVDKALLCAELTPDKKIQDTSHGNNELYVVDGHDSPNVLREIGRLREISFRAEGGSVGAALDLDEFDTMESPYKQLILWDPEEQAIIGGYRYIFGSDVKLREDGQPHMTSSHLFHYSDKFIKDYLPYTMELGRSFVAPEYQSSKAGAKAIFALDSLWDGIFSVMLTHANVMYMIGKATIYPSYDSTARDLIFHYLDKYFADKEALVTPYHPFKGTGDPRMMNLILKDDNLKDDYKNLKAAVRMLGGSIPPLVNSYMTLSPTMKVFGTAVNDEMSDILDTGLMICFDEIYDDKRGRRMENYIHDLMNRAKRRWPQMEEGLRERIISRLEGRRKHSRERREEKISRRERKEQEKRVKKEKKKEGKRGKKKEEKD